MACKASRASRSTSILAHLDEIGSRLVTLAPAEQRATRAGSRQSRVVDEPARTVRADIAEMDAVLDGVAETHALLNGLRGADRECRAGCGILRICWRRNSRLSRHRQAAAGRPVQPSPTRRLAQLRDELRRKLGGVGRKLGSTVDQMDRELRQLRDAAERLRLVPAGSLFTALERTARDTARALGQSR